MQNYELTVPSGSDAQSLIAALLERSALDAGLDAGEATEITTAVTEAVAAIRASLTADYDANLPLTVGTNFDGHEFCVEILERGRPMADGNATDPTVGTKHHELLGRLFDTIGWRQIAPVGSELRLQRRVRREDTDPVTSATPPPAHADESIPEIPSAPEQDYAIRRFEERDAIHIAQSIYEAYGHTYLDPGLYDPARITDLNRSGRLRSVIAEAEDGSVVGHYALERPDPERATESGQAVVDQAHRRRHLLDKMHAELVDWARELSLPGFYGRSTARHPASQKMNERFGAVPVGLCLAYSPASMRLRHNPAAGSGDRPSSVLYWTGLADVGRGPCHIPQRIAPTAEPILRSLGFDDVRASDNSAPAILPRHGSAPIQSQASLHLGLASLLVEEVSAASAPALAQCCADLLGMEQIFSIVLHLPLDDPHTPWLAGLALQEQGFNLAGILPFDLPGGRHGLLLERTRAHVDSAGLRLESQVARDLLALARL